MKTPVEPFATTARDLYHHVASDEENDPLVAAEWMYRRREVHRLLERAIARFPTRPLTICDVGSGTGFNLYYALRRLLAEHEELAPSLRESEIVTLDVPSEWPERLRHVLALIGFDRYRHVDCDLATGLPLETASVDAVICTEVVEHLEHPASLFHEFSRVIRPEGALILTTPNEPSLPGKIASWLHGRAWRVSRDESAETVDGVTLYGHISTKPTAEWESLLAQSGFAVEAYGLYRIVGNPANRDVTSNRIAAVAARFILAGLIAPLPPRLRRFFGADVTLLLRRTP
ncbi:MAG TPA: class I SAM-dependent methyltransferase [Gaiellaceae bacterium]|nr:class I SAM-dependent methyltransferase [Gaiellaceae bacterium]